MRRRIGKKGKGKVKATKDKEKDHDDFNPEIEEVELDSCLDGAV
jgi:hypothetical protein